MTITADEILGTLEALSTVSTGNLPTGARKLLKKLHVQAAKINVGAATPAYMNTGRSSLAQKITLEALGGTEDDSYASNHIPNPTAADLFRSSNSSAHSGSSGSVSSGTGDLDEQETALLEELDRQMREELAASSPTAAENIILEERRKSPRNPLEAFDTKDF